MAHPNLDRFQVKPIESSNCIRVVLEVAGSQEPALTLELRPFQAEALIMYLEKFLDSGKARLPNLCPWVVEFLTVKRAKPNAPAHRHQYLLRVGHFLIEEEEHLSYHTHGGQLLQLIKDLEYLCSRAAA